MTRDNVRWPTLPLCLMFGAVTMGCPADDTPEVSETEAASSTGGSTAGEPPSATTTTDPGTTSTDPGTTASVDESSGGSTDGTTGEPPAGVCLGIETIGDLGMVAGREGATVDTTCSPTPAGCGGDVVGTWTIHGSCGYEALGNPLEEECPGSTFGINILSDTGTLVFGADGSVNYQRTTQSEILLSLDTQACYGASCEDFEAAAMIDDPDVMCTETGPTECSCIVPLEPEVVDAVGTYTTDGEQLSLSSAEGDTDWTYCIEGDRFTSWQVLYDVVETRQECTDETDCFDALGDEYLGYVCEFEGDE